MITTVSATHDGWLQRVVPAVAADGCAIVTDVLSPASIDATRSAMYRVRERIIAAVGEDRLVRAGELGVLRLMLGYDEHFLRLLELAPMLAVVDATVSPTATLHLQNGLILPPLSAAEGDRGKFQFSYHRDFPRVLNGFVASVNCFFAIDPFTEANGATRVVPRSHQRSEPVDPQDLAARSVPVECPAGSMIVFDSTLWHAAGRNETRNDRLAINHQFTRSYFKPQIDYTRAIGQPKMATLPERTQQLLGQYTRVPASLDEFYRPEAERLYRRGQG